MGELATAGLSRDPTPTTSRQMEAVAGIFVGKAPPGGPLKLVNYDRTAES